MAVTVGGVALIGRVIWATIAGAIRADATGGTPAPLEHYLPQVFLGALLTVVGVLLPIYLIERLNRARRADPDRLESG